MKEPGGGREVAGGLAATLVLAGVAIVFVASGTTAEREARYHHICELTASTL